MPGHGNFSEAYRLVGKIERKTNTFTLAQKAEHRHEALQKTV
jgi:hypothetical protein